MTTDDSILGTETEQVMSYFLHWSPTIPDDDHLEHSKRIIIRQPDFVELMAGREIVIDDVLITLSI